MLFVVLGAYFNEKTAKSLYLTVRKENEKHSHFVNLLMINPLICFLINGDVCV